MLEKVFNSLNELVCVFDLQFRFVYINKAAFNILGYTPEELIGTCCANLIVAEDRESSFGASLNAYNGANIPHYENRYKRKDGEEVTIFWEGSWNHEHNLLFCTGRDVTEQKLVLKREQEYRQELLNAKNQLEQVLERITDGFIALDDQARVVYINYAASQISEIAWDKIIGQVIWEVLPEQSAKHTHQLYQEAVTKRVPYHVEYFSPRLNRWVEANAYPSGSGLSVFLRDVTERKKLHQELNKAKEQQQKRIAKAVIKATEAERAQVGRELHDNVNQVLTTVKLYTELCQEGIGDTSDLLSRSQGLLQGCIDEIRALSKRLLAPPLVDVSLQESISELVETIRAAGRFAIHLQLQTEAFALSPEVHTVIYRIIQEHFANIMKHAHASQVSCSMKVRHNTLELTITDDGQGFDIHAATRNWN